MLLNSKLCADAGSVNCPCYLAEYGKCIVCSRLGAGRSVTHDAGRECNSCDESGAAEVCNCQWQGMCIYNEYLQNSSGAVPPVKGSGEEHKSGATGERRYSMCCRIRKIIWYEENLAVMQVEVPAGIAEKASLPGSYVFMKRPADEPFFYTPLSIMYADYEKGVLYIAVQVNGPKTKALLGSYAGNCENISLMNDAGACICEVESSICNEKKCACDVKSPIDNEKECACDAKLPIGDSNERAADYVELRGIYRNGMLGAQKLMKTGAVAASGAEAAAGTEPATGAKAAAGAEPAAGTEPETGAELAARAESTAGTKAASGAESTAGTKAASGAESAAEPNGAGIIGGSASGSLKVLCLCKGLGLAPVANYIRWAGGKHHIDVIADLDKINRRFADDALDAAGRSAVNSVEFRKLPLDFSWAEQEKYDVIIISASDFYQQNIYVPQSKKVLSNNHTMCCGEGICGACICMNADGTSHRMCKECEVR